jgi:hypothetical protein
MVSVRSEGGKIQRHEHGPGQAERALLGSSRLANEGGACLRISDQHAPST